LGTVRGCPCPLAGRSLRASLPSAHSEVPALSPSGLRWPPTPTRWARATPHGLHNQKRQQQRPLVSITPRPGWPRPPVRATLGVAHDGPSENGQDARAGFPWKKASLPFSHLVDRRKSRGFPGSTIAASCGSAKTARLCSRAVTRQRNVQRGQDGRGRPSGQPLALPMTGQAKTGRMPVLASRGKRHPCPFPTWSTAGKAEVFLGRQSPLPAAARKRQGFAAVPLRVSVTCNAGRMAAAARPGNPWRCP